MSYQPDDHRGILKESAVMLGSTRITREAHVQTLCLTHAVYTRVLYKLYKKNTVNSVPPVVYFRNAQWINLSVEIR